MSKTKNKNVLKVIQLGLQDKIYEAMKLPDFSISNITKQLNAEGHNITYQSIRKFINNTKDAQQKLISKDIKLSKEIMKTAMDYNKALKNILKEVEEIKDDAKNERDYTTYNQLVGRLYQGIELIAKLTGDIKPQQNIDVKIIYNQISDEITNNMQDVRKDIFDKLSVIDVDAEVIEEDKKIVKGEKI